MLLAVQHEQPTSDAAAIRSHVAECDACAGRWRDLAEADAAVAALLHELDHPLPSDNATTWLRARPHRLRRALLTAAAAVTLTVAAAATIVPSSPLRRWINDRRDVPPARAIQPDSSASATAVTPLASGIAIHAPRNLTVVFRREQNTGVIEIARSRSGEVTFRSRGGFTAYELAVGQVSIDNRVPADAYLIDLPPAVQRLRILVGDRVLLRWPEDSARVMVTQDSQRVRVVLDLSRPVVP